MGTSGSSRGSRSKTPIVPSWTDRTKPSMGLEGSEQSTGGKPQQMQLPPIPPADAHQRFRPMRVNLTKFVNSSNPQHLSRSVSEYVSKGLGGSKSATRRMAVSRSVGGRLADFINEYKQNGPDAALEKYDLKSLKGKRAKDVLLALTDAICLPTGPLDESLARKALLETIDDLAKEGVTDFQKMTDEQWDDLLTGFIARSISARLLLESVQAVISASKDAKEASRIEAEVTDYIERKVRTAVKKHFKNVRTKKAIESMMERIYRASFDLLQVLSKQHNE